ncbi:Developmental protein fluG [Aspergillus sp. HF37]|nr:Developmental protein fluG [Aspergillus sp. HF37]
MASSSLDSLRHLVRAHPLIDNHAHNVLSSQHACNYAKYPLESVTSEAQGPALQNAVHALPSLRAASQLADLYHCAPDWASIKAAREQWVHRDYEGLVRRCLEGTHALLLDDLLTDDDIEPFDWHDRFTVSETKRIVRIETLASKILVAMRDSGDLPDDHAPLADYMARFDLFQESFKKMIASSIADPNVVGYKSVVCYRTGLNVEEPRHDAVFESFARTARQTGSVCRVEDKPFNDWLVLRTLEVLGAAKNSTAVSKPLQLHTGLGDSDISLILSNPAYLQPVIARFPDVDFVLLHSSYPYTREAGYLACVYANVYLDLGEVFPMVSRDAEESIIRQSLEIVPTNRLLWSTDGHFHPDTFWLSNRQFRQALETVLVDYVVHGDYTVSQAMDAAADILFHNSNRLYALNQTPRYSPSSAIQKPSTTPSAALQDFIRRNPDVQFVWMQWVDYTATVRTRMFPMHEFAKIVRKQRRIGISLAVFWMVQDDSTAPEGSTTGQFYMEPDLSSLCRNVGSPSKTSASVMTFWRSENDAPLEGCPRTTLQNLVTRFQAEHGVSLTFGFEIETVFLKPVHHPSGSVSYIPAVNNHSWSRLTPESQTLLPLVEEIVHALASINIPLEQFHPESSPSQFEFVLPPAPPLQAVDTLLTARAVISSLAASHGLRASLHPRPLPSSAGSAAHAHISLSPPDSARELERSFLAGILHHYPALTAFTLAQDASYERVKSGLWAGSEWVAWGTQNRETPVRKISQAHWEIKSIDGLANMYLAMAASLAAGFLGVQAREELTFGDCRVDTSNISPPERKALGITTPLPKSLSESMAALQADEALQSMLGRDFVRNYLSVKRMERNKLNAMGEEERRTWLVEQY